MGCDIHMIAEKKSRYDDDKNGWEPLLAPIFKNRYYREAEPLTDFNTPYTFQPYDDRNYEVYAVLANVRNGRDIDPISEPKGYPDNMHPVSRWLLDGYDFADHSFTWLGLEEVRAYQWAKYPSEYRPYGTLADSAKEFLTNMDTLNTYSELENCDIRLVFGFDS